MLMQSDSNRAQEFMTAHKNCDESLCANALWHEANLVPGNVRCHSIGR